MQVAVPTGVVEGQLMVKLLIEIPSAMSGRLLDETGKGGEAPYFCNTY